MFELIFGSFWTLFTAFMTFMFYGDTGGTITVNGVATSQAEFNAMLWPKLFFGLFWLIGLFMIFLGLKKLFTNYQTKIKGVEKDGYVVDVEDSGVRVNGRIYYDAKIVIQEDDYSYGTYKDSVGPDFEKYPIGSYVRVKHYKKDINILESISEYNISESLKEYVETNYPNNFIDIDNPVVDTADTIEINGVTYVRKED